MGEAKQAQEQDRAHASILVELVVLGHPAYVQLWPFIVGTLLRSVRGFAEMSPLTKRT
jgi:hypothetical protein